MREPWLLSEERAVVNKPNDNYTAHFPENLDNGQKHENYRFIKIIAGKKSYRFRYDTVEGGSGHKILLGEKRFKKINDLSPVVVKKISTINYLWHSLTNENLFAFVILLIGLLAGFIDGALKLADEGIGFSSPEFVIRSLRIIWLVLIAAGALVVFIKELLRK
ncbi:MAG: hypothetical protein ABI184_01590 [Ginsengibacter sp.]